MKENQEYKPGNTLKRECPDCPHKNMVVRKRTRDESY